MQRQRVSGSPLCPIPLPLKNLKERPITSFIILIGAAVNALCAQASAPGTGNEGTLPYVAVAAVQLQTLVDHAILQISDPESAIMAALFRPNGFLLPTL